ncbi:MAG: serine/threonine protein kinase [Planctomycetes bacterium]|nr:serine/threonine protein kinase [Planctomycetota bacterium]
MAHRGRQDEETGSERQLIDAAQLVAFGAGSSAAGFQPDPLSKSYFQPAPDSVPGYSIVREIHRGAQGVVYQALQNGTKRRVAIKIMRDDPFAGPRGRLRFEREIQILSQLDHPNIVTVHDSGSSQGRFYYVMDYISGQPLDVYLASSGPSVSEVLRLFEKICSAVHAAHLRGVIHRDLKPGNIRISAAGEPYILDFGLAKVTTGSPGEVAPSQAMTMTGQFVGSLPWSSPEQARGESAGIDIRTDVYSLGVILYQALTGRFPYEVVGSFRDVLDNILNAEPVAPRKLRRQIDDEVQTMVLRCLCKDADRRYQTAGELGRDLARYLAGEPIEAKRDSRWYILRKTLRPYRAALAVAAVFAMTVMSFSAVTWFWYQRARTAESRQRFVQDSSDETLVYVGELLRAGSSGGPREDPAAARARGDALAESVAWPRKREHAERVELLRHRLDESLRRVATERGGDPIAEAGLRHTYAGIFQSLGLFTEAQEQYELALALRRRELGENHPDVAATLHNLAVALHAKDERAAAISIFRQALAIRRGALGDQHRDVAATLNDLGLCLKNDGKSAEANPLLREAVGIRRQVLGDRDPDLATSLYNLGATEWHLGDYTAAEAHYLEALAIRRAVYGEEHKEVAAVLNHLGAVACVQGDYQRAEELYRAALDMRRRIMGDEHPDVAGTLNNLGSCLREKGDFAEALPLFEEALARVEQQTDLSFEQHQYRARMMTNVASCLLPLGRLEEAERLLIESLSLKWQNLDQDNTSLATTRHYLAELQFRRGDLAGAESLCNEALEQRRHELGAEHPRVAASLHLLGRIRLERGDAVGAAGPLADAVRMRRRTFAEGNWLTATAERDLGRCLTALARFDESEALLLRSHESLHAARGDGDPEDELSVRALVALYTAWNRPEQAAAFESVLTSHRGSR